MTAAAAVPEALARKLFDMFWQARYGYRLPERVEKLWNDERDWWMKAADHALAAVDREALAKVLHGSLEPLNPTECSVCRHSLYEADRILASGVLTDAAAVRAAARREVAEEIAQALADQIGSTSYRDAAFQQAVRIARAAANGSDR
jgi:hypothetical protein